MEKKLKMIRFYYKVKLFSLYLDSLFLKRNTISRDEISNLFLQLICLSK
jgi:hypothetical protein